MLFPLRTMKPNLVALALWLCACAWAAHAETVLVGPSADPSRLAEAIAAARDGDVIEILPGEYKGAVAVVPARRLTIRGVGKRPVIHAAGKAAEGKGLWVVRGGDVTIENLEFRGARAPDADGSALRLEDGRLRVSNCAFFDNEHAIITSNAATSELVVENSLFAEVPRVVGGLYHLVSVGRIARFSVSGSRFHQGFEGHLIKSRARETRITYNLIHDGPAGEASYEIDLPNGGLAWIVGNVIGQSSNTQNPVVVAYGAEGRPWEKNALYLAHNTLLNDRWVPAWFLRVWRERLPNDTPVTAVNNLTVGPGVFTWGASGEFVGNHPTVRRSLVDPATMAFELAIDSWLRGRGVDPRNIDGQDLAPKAEFTFPVGTRPLPPTAANWSPGAFQR
jgi:hypothetical protein